MLVLALSEASNPSLGMQASHPGGGAGSRPDNVFVIGARSFGNRFTIQLAIWSDYWVRGIRAVLMSGQWSMLFLMGCGVRQLPGERQRTEEQKPWTTS
jgi:hypothetical protein